MNIPSSIKAYKAKWKDYKSNLKICVPEKKKKSHKPRGGERKETPVRKFNEIICL